MPPAGTLGLGEGGPGFGEPADERCGAGFEGRCRDDRRSGEIRTVEVGGERNYQNGLQHPVEGVTLPDDDRAATGLLLWAMGSEICPPDLATLQ
jgi:hypothetical protein